MKHNKKYKITVEATILETELRLIKKRMIEELKVKPSDKGYKLIDAIITKMVELNYELIEFEMNNQEQTSI